MRFGFAGGGDHLGLGRIGLAVAYVVERRPVEHSGFLRDHPDLTPQALLGDLAHILPVDQNVTLLRRIEPQQQ